jgi:hypothetical protein
MLHSIDWADGSSRFGHAGFEAYCWEMEAKALRLVKGAFPHPLLAEMKIAGTYAYVAHLYDSIGETEECDKAVRTCLAVTQRIVEELREESGFLASRRVREYVGDPETLRAYFDGLQTKEAVLAWKSRTGPTK